MALDSIAIKAHFNGWIIYNVHQTVGILQHMPNVTLREKGFKAIALKRRYPGQSIVTKLSYQDMVKTLNGFLYPEIYTQYQV